MKKGGSAALAAMLRQRSEVIQAGGAPEAPVVVALAPPAPLAEGENLPRTTHPAARALEEAVQAPRTAPPPPPATRPPPPSHAPPVPTQRSTSPAPGVRSLSPARAAADQGQEPLLISHPKRSFSPNRNASPTPAVRANASPTPALRPSAPSTAPSASSAPAAAPRNPSPLAGLPKTIPFSGANKCTVCDKTVYKMEEVIAVGHVWHDKCFTCGGHNGDGCGKVLRRDGYVDHGGEPYCQACYNKLFRPKGYNTGANLHTDYGTVQPASVPEVTAEAGRMKITTQASYERPAPPVHAQTAPQTAAQTHAAAPAPLARTPSALGGGNKCSICTKTVYKMEEIIALGRIWHDKCFTCGAIETATGQGRDEHPGCGKVLKRDGYLDHANRPYCTTCHAKYFGPKTFGHGILTESTVPSGAPEVVRAPAAAPAAPAAKTAPPAPAAPASKPSIPPPPSRVAPTPANPPLIATAAGQQQVGGGAKVVIGATSKASNNTLYREAGYVGEGDEVDESEW